MKYSSLLLLFNVILFVTSTIQAQTERGSVQLSIHNFSPRVPEYEDYLVPTNAIGVSFGKLKTTKPSTEDLKYLTIGLNGSVHYFLNDNFSGGFSLDFMAQKVTEAGDEIPEYRTRLFMIGPELRYFFPFNTHTKIWIEGFGTFGASRLRLGDAEPELPIQLSRFGASTGLAFFINQRCSVDLGFGYSVFKAERTDPSDELKQTNSGAAISIGFSVYL